MDEAFYRLVRIMGTFDLATGHADSWDELLDSLESELRDVLGHLRAQQCVCGEPKTSGTHRIDGPCYAEQPRGEATSAQVQEPYAWEFIGSIWHCKDEVFAYAKDPELKNEKPPLALYTTPQPPAQQQEPVYYQWRRKNMDWDTYLIFNYQVEATTDDSEVRELYTTQQPAQPLTDEQIREASLQAGMQEHYMGFHSGFIRFARAIEAAHGIIGSKT